jgi:hypothetical protein
MCWKSKLIMSESCGHDLPNSKEVAPCVMS